MNDTITYKDVWVYEEKSGGYSVNYNPVMHIRYCENFETLKIPRNPKFKTFGQALEWIKDNINKNCKVNTVFLK